MSDAAATSQEVPGASPPAAAPGAPRWRILVTPRWLGWHAFAVAAVVGMCWLGDWQYRRAMAGNTLSWAYTFEWPIFGIFGVVFWVKTIKDELRPPEPAAFAAEVDLPAGAQPGSGVDAEALALSGGADGNGAGDAEADAELAEYNAYLARLGREVKGHGRWHGLR